MFPSKSKREEVIFHHRHREGLSGHGVGSFSGCTVFSEDFLSPGGVAVSKTEILLAFSYAQREVGTLILTYTGSVSAWLRMLEYFPPCYGDAWRDFCAHKRLLCGFKDGNFLKEIIFILQATSWQTAWVRSQKKTFMYVLYYILEELLCSVH